MKNHFNLLQFLLTFLMALGANGQQDPHYSLYRNNLSVINPAVAGAQNRLEGFVGARSQWSGVTGGPETQSFNVNSPVAERLGIGLNVVHDRVFVLRETNFFIDFSYRLSLSSSTDIYLGIKTGGSFLNVDLDALGITDDPLFGQNVSRFNPNVGLGMYLKGERFFMSLSAPGFLENTRYEKEGVQPVEASDRLHLFFSGGYELPISENWSIVPSTLVKAVVGAPVSIDLSGTLNYLDRIEFGANYRLDESITGLFTIALENWGRLGYAYEHTLTDINVYTSGTHEVFLKLMFPYKSNKP